MASVWPFGTVVAAIVPAHNEQAYIARAVDSLNECKREGIVHEVVVVSDGSTDNTAQIARNAGADDVIELKRNIGKAGAFAEGARQVEKRFLGGDRKSLDYRVRKGSVVLVSLDADVEISPKQVRELVEPVVRDRGLNMTIGELKPHPAYITSNQFSGQRAIRLEAIGGMLRGTKTWQKVFETGYGLEMALNRAIKERKFAETNFEELRPPGEKNRLRLEREMWRTAEHFRERERTARFKKNQHRRPRRK